MKPKSLSRWFALIQQHGMDRNSVILSLTLATYLVPMLLDLVLNPWQRVFNYFAADTFYYLTVARNFGQSGVFSFDQLLPTNGFHPLWQVITGLVFAVGQWAGWSEAAMLVVVLLVSMGCVGLAFGLIGRALVYSRQRLPVFLVALPVGLYAVLLAPIESRFGSAWNYTNAMESPVVLLSYAMLLWWVMRPGWLETTRSAILTGLILSLIFLARLDHALLVVAFGAGLLFQAGITQNWKLLRRGLWVGGILAGVLGAYLLTNYLSVGLWLPVSGSIKSTFPIPSGWNVKLSELSLLLPRLGQADFGASIWRYAQILLPMFLAVPVCGLWLYRSIKKPFDALFHFWGSSALFVLGLGSYNFLFVPTNDQGYWYFPVSMLWMSLVCIDGSRGLEWFNRHWKLTATGLALGSVLFFALVYQRNMPNQRYAVLYNERSSIQAHFDQAQARPKVIEYDDGIIAFTTRFTTLSGFGFCLDPEAAQARQANRLIDLAYDRGYRYLASYYYFSGQFTEISSPEEIKTYLQSIAGFIHQADLSQYSFTLEYKGVNGKFRMLRMQRAP